MNKRRQDKIYLHFTLKNRDERENIQPVSELCLANICIMHSDRTALVPISPASFVPRNWRRPVSRAAKATKKRLSKGRKGLSSPRALRLCYRLVPGEAALGTAARGKLPLCRALRHKRAVFHGWRGAPEFQRCSRSVGFLRDETSGLGNFVVVDCSYIKSKVGTKKGGGRKKGEATSVWLVERR